MKSNNIQESGLGDLLLVLRRNIRENIKKEGLKHDLTFSQVEALRFIGSHGEKTMREIANYLKITPPSVTEIVGDMEKKGLVKRKSGKVDRRVVFIVLSDTSKKLYASLNRQKNAVFKKMISKLNEKDKKNLERIIRILIEEE